MSTHTVSPLESTVEKHIDSTSRLVRRVDLALSLLIVSSLLFGGLFLAILADHWLLKEGLSMMLRFGIFVALFAAVGLYIYWRIVPLFRYSINPIYTADLIEQDVPTFKNSLINWLLLRQEREERDDVPTDKINDRMFDGMVRTAAAKVQTVPVGHAVDYRKLIWVGTFLAVLLFSFITYTIFSPKNPFTSIGRVLFPAAGIEHPQAVQFKNVDPGDTTALQGETLAISAEVISQSTEPVYLVFSTDDGQAVQQRIPMSRPEGRIAFETPFPSDRHGFNSSVDYWIAQGESRSKQYRIEVLPAATVEIVSLRYDFPDYTGLPPETKTIEHGGDIRALEGTKVTVTVRSTLPLQEIALVFNDRPTSPVKMTIDGQGAEAKGEFKLDLVREYKSFDFRATDTNGNKARRSGIYRVEVIPDQPPKVQWADTASNLKEVPHIDLPLNETLPLPIQAEDPDFALRYLRFKTESPGKRIPDIQLLDSPVSGPTAHRGQINRTVSFSPATRHLAVGDTVEIWTEAIDTKLPEANVSTTRRITINVIKPVEKDEKDESQQNQKQNEQKNGNGESKQDNTQEQGADKTGEKDPTRQDNQPGQEQDPKNPNQNPDQNNHPDQKEGAQDQKQNERNSNGQEQDTNNPEQDGPNQNGTPGGGGEQPEDQSGDSNQGNAGNDRSDSEGNQVSEGDVNHGKASDEPAGQPTGEQSSGDQGGEPATQQEQQTQRSSPNPETQPGEAMERIVEQMKEDGKFDDSENNQQKQGEKGTETQDTTGTGPRERDHTLDPNSQNRSNQGSDPSDPKESSNQQSPDGTQQNQSPKTNGEGGTKPEKSSGEGNTNPDSGQSNNTNPAQNEEPSGDTQQGGKETTSGERGSQGEQQGNPGESNQGESGTGESSSNQQPQDGTEPQDTNGIPSQTRGTNGGTGGTGKHTTPDDPNVEYAEKVTNLVLEYLEDQLKEKPSDELLNKLDWTEEQLRQFYEKWKGMAEKSKQPQRSEDRTNFWEALKSLGMRPPNQDHSTVQRNPTTKQDNKPVTEALQYEQPPAMRDKARRYNDGIGIGK